VSAQEGPSLPHVGVPVALVLEDDHSRARVSDVQPGLLELAVSHVPAALRNAEAVDGRIEFAGDEGPCRLLGTARKGPPHVTPLGSELRLHFSFGASPQLLLRTERVRAPVEVPIEFTLRGEWRLGETRDLRGGGALIVGPIDLALGDLVRYRLKVAGQDDPVEGQARVARIAENGDVAIHFDELSESDRALVMLTVFEAQRRR